MVRDEAKNGREAHARGRRTARTETPESLPLVSAKRGKFEPLKDTKIEAVVFARLGDYKAFVKEIEGEEPDEGAIVSAGLEMLFQADKGFERWQGEQRKRERQPEEKSHANSALRATASSPTPAAGTA